MYKPRDVVKCSPVRTGNKSQLRSEKRTDVTNSPDHGRRLKYLTHNLSLKKKNSFQ